ncbi:MAG: iron-sulfur cluster assembly protein [Chthoniobacteraceae bacterium]
MSLSLTREIEAIRIPSGEKVTLPVGTEIAVTQALGNTYTVAAMELGGLFRVEGKDADAIGEKPTQAPEKVKGEGTLEEQVWAQLKNCYDPEIPVDIVNLGLIYGMELVDANGGKNAEVKMTLTAPGCGMGPAIAYDAQQRILTIDGINDANVELVWDPPWSPDRISAEGRQRLGMD